MVAMDDMVVKVGTVAHLMREAKVFGYGGETASEARQA